MAPQITGKYEYVSGDNFEAYLKATGLSAEHVEIGKQLKPVLEFTENGDSYNMKINTEVMNKDINFKLGDEINEKTPGGFTAKATFTKNGNHLVQKQSVSNGFEATLDHEFKDDGLVLTYTWTGGKATRNYKRV